MLVAKTGADALSLATKYKPTAVSLDVFLPDMLGWTVLNQLKRNPETRHIPVQILTIEDERQYGLERGAFSFMTKTVTTDSLEVAFDRLKNFTNSRITPAARGRGRSGRADERHRAARPQRRGDPTAATGAAALEMMREGTFDCVVLDLRLPDMSGFELLAEVQKEPTLRDTPIIVFTGRELSEAEETELRKKAKSIVLKGVRSPERLLDETALFLHRVIADLPAVEAAHDRDPARERRAAARPQGAGGRR